MIEIRIDQLLEERGRTFYWLSKETGISHTTLWRLKKGRAVGINFPTLEQICRTLSCQPGDVLKLADEKKAGKKACDRRANDSSGAHAPAAAPAGLGGLTSPGAVAQRVYESSLARSLLSSSGISQIT